MRVNRQTWKSLSGPILILVAFWAARHLHHASFGFYEDDYTLVVRAMAAPWSEVREFVSGLLTRFGGQGRPLQHSLVFVLGHVTGLLGGREAAYWLAYVIVSANCILFYILFRKLVDSSFALVGGLAYALFSADTTQAFLYHAFGLQQSLTFLVLASLAYISHKRILSYVLILGSLLSYETAFLVFLGVPLLEPRWDRAWLKQMGLHGVAMIGILGVVTAARVAVGENRVLGLELWDLVGVTLLHMVQGPLVSFGSYFLRPLQAIAAADIEIVTASIVSFAIFSWALRQGAFPGLDAAPVSEKTDGAAQGWRQLTQRIPPLAHQPLRLLLAGVIMLALAYPLTFTIRAYAISGRDTRVHLAAVFGASLVWASSWYLAFSLAKRAWVRRGLVGTLSAIFALLVGFGLVVQKDYARAWELQRRLWTSLVQYVPDVEQHTVVFVDPSGLDDTSYIDANTWSLPLVFKYVYAFPQEWDGVPRVHRLLPDWRQRSLINPVEIKAVDVLWQYVVVPWEEAVVLESSKGRIVGRLDEARVDGEAHSLKPPPDQLPTQPRFTPGLLYDELMIRSP